MGSRDAHLVAVSAL